MTVPLATSSSDTADDETGEEDAAADDDTADDDPAEDSTDDDDPTRGRRSSARLGSDHGGRDDQRQAEQAECSVETHRIKLLVREQTDATRRYVRATSELAEMR